MQIIVSSVLAIVIATTLLLGSAMPAFIKFNLDKISQSEKYLIHPSTNESMDGVKENPEKR